MIDGHARPPRPSRLPAIQEIMDPPRFDLQFGTVLRRLKEEAFPLQSAISLIIGLFDKIFSMTRYFSIIEYVEGGAISMERLPCYCYYLKT